MPAIQSLEAFYARKFDKNPSLSANGVEAFNVFRLTDSRNSSTAASPYARYDFYKIMLINGQHRCHYADKSIAFAGSTLLFFNPAVPYRFERLGKQSTGFFCVFKESFYTESFRKGIHDLPMFTPGGKPVYALNETRELEVATLFEKMLNEMHSDYRFKYDLLRNYVSELLHCAMKMEPHEQLYHHPDTNARITSIFMALLERQFPIDLPGQPIQMRSPSDFADKLGVHVNHLNRAVRLTTGKTTTAHIAERMAAEATALLKHTNWNISEISYSLGFAHPSYFTSFFKKQTKVTPTSIRLV
ncbi:helix-turn-helix domain-containing protein [Olivibacter sp. LS-1]|uniref:helix-turn-helix domain-containing protein n=1 Tax=Olivibacter sp. LS-1 TaxID=2592345 RepID=UPI0011EAB567|nr:AraC family transcriptional regulator [Olivibacter sp. LS-1]QEL03321.1 helix-turn-helix domain-containing protein [Olivibacter sp. LS-1]